MLNYTLYRLYSTSLGGIKNLVDDHCKHKIPENSAFKSEALKTQTSSFKLFNN